MRIRQFSIDDYSVVFELWKLAGLIIRPGDGLEEIKLKLQRDSDLFLVAQEAGEIVGTVMGAWDGRRGWIYHLAVKPGQQRRGIGSALVKQVEDQLFAKGAKKVNAQIYASNQPSLAFFKAEGYEAQPELIMIGKQLRRA